LIFSFFILHLFFALYIFFLFCINFALFRISWQWNCYYSCSYFTNSLFESLPENPMVVCFSGFPNYLRKINELQLPHA
jgi:hypothetical protein